MLSATAEAQTPVIVHRLPGRMRVHLPLWTGMQPRRATQRLRELHGVSKVEVNALTKNALLLYDRTVTSEDAVLAQVSDLQQEFATYRDVEAKAPPASARQQGHMVRARIAVRGMDHVPAIAQRVVDRLERTPGVREGKPDDGPSSRGVFAGG